MGGLVFFINGWSAYLSYSEPLPFFMAAIVMTFGSLVQFAVLRLGSLVVHRRPDLMELLRHSEQFGALLARVSTGDFE